MQHAELTFGPGLEFFLKIRNWAPNTHKHRRPFEVILARTDGTGLGWFCSIGQGHLFSQKDAYAHKPSLPQRSLLGHLLEVLLVSGWGIGVRNTHCEPQRGRISDHGADTRQYGGLPHKVTE